SVTCGVHTKKDF
ncbi:unnamed protein product, partial [Allacma fusca]